MSEADKIRDQLRDRGVEIMERPVSRKVPIGLVFMGFRVLGFGGEGCRV